MEWKEYKTVIGQLTTRDVVQLSPKAMEFLEDKIQLKSIELTNHAKKEFDAAARVLKGEACYQRKNTNPYMTKVLNEVYNFTDKGLVDAHIACFRINHADFRGLPDQYIVDYVDNDKGEVRLKFLDSTIKNRMIPDQYRKQWHFFIDLLPTITFKFDELEFYKMCSAF